MAVLISLSLKLPPCSGKEARINAVAFLRELSIWMWTFLSLTARLRSNGGEALDWHIAIKLMSSDAAKKEEQPNQHFGCNAKQCVGSETQTKDAKQTSNIPGCSQDHLNWDQVTTKNGVYGDRDLERLRTNQVNCEKIIIRHCRISNKYKHEGAEINFTNVI